MAAMRIWALLMSDECRQSATGALDDGKAKEIGGKRTRRKGCFFQHDDRIGDGKSCNCRTTSWLPTSSSRCRSWTHRWRSLIELHLCAHLRAVDRAAWTDVVGVGVVRRPILRKIAMFSQGLSHLRLDPVRR
jgi:hypothetical protein